MINDFHINGQKHPGRRVCQYQQLGHDDSDWTYSSAPSGARESATIEHAGVSEAGTKEASLQFGGREFATTTYEVVAAGQRIGEGPASPPANGPNLSDTTEWEMKKTGTLPILSGGTYHRQRATYSAGLVWEVKKHDTAVAPGTALGTVNVAGWSKLLGGSAGAAVSCGVGPLVKVELTVSVSYEHGWSGSTTFSSSYTTPDDGYWREVIFKQEVAGFSRFVESQTSTNGTTWTPDPDNTITVPAPYGDSGTNRYFVEIWKLCQLS